MAKMKAVKKIVFEESINAGLALYFIEYNIQQNQIKITAKEENNILWENVLNNIELRNINIDNIEFDKIKLSHIINNELYLVINNSINKIDKCNGEITSEYYFGNTPIKKIISDDDCFYIVFDYYEFDNTKYYSNLMCINNTFEIRWYAELPDNNDIYTGFSNEDEYITGYTWDCWRCRINKIDGKIMDKKLYALRHLAAARSAKNCIRHYAPLCSFSPVHFFAP